jgi:predicted nucleotidyltransferase
MSDVSSWLGKRTIFLGIYGSHAHGTSAPESDLDLRGVVVAPRLVYLGCTRSFEQAAALPATFWTDLPGGGSERPARATGERATDVELMEVRKFLRLASDCNPNIVEILFLPEDCVAFEAPAWHVIRDARECVLSKRARFTFAGYAHSQLKRIRTHRRWLLEPPKSKPERADFGLPERLPIPKDQFDAARAMVERRIQEWTVHPDVAVPETVLAKLRDTLTDLVASVVADRDRDSAMTFTAGHELGMSDGFLELLDRERRYRQALAWWHQFHEWQANRNPARAATEARCGYDTKHAMHLVRLLRMACEILRDHAVIVRRPDAAELQELRRGEWTFDRVMEESDRLEAEAARLYETTTLPASSDRDAIDRACLRAIEAVGA